MSFLFLCIKHVIRSFPTNLKFMSFFFANVPIQQFQEALNRKKDQGIPNMLPLESWFIITKPNRFFILAGFSTLFSTLQINSLSRKFFRFEMHFGWNMIHFAIKLMCAVLHTVYDYYTRFFAMPYVLMHWGKSSACTI